MRQNQVDRIGKSAHDVFMSPAIRYSSKDVGKLAERLMEESFIEARKTETTYNYNLAHLLYFVSSGHSHEEEQTVFWGRYQYDDPDRFWMVALVVPGEA